MISTTHSHARERGLAGTDRAARGMTLVELIIGMTLASVLMTAVLSSFLFLGRSGFALSHYNEMELQARLGLERFAEDVRQASDLAWDSDTQVTLTVGPATVIYGYDAARKSVYRETGGVRHTMLEGIETFVFTGYAITGAPIVFTASNPASRLQAGHDTKQLQISMRAVRTRATIATTTNTVLSARFILRNKKVTA